MDISKLRLEAFLPYVNEIMDTNDKMLTDIYVITNKVTNKKYVGQANTHRLNHGKYRPFGYERRLKDHISEAMCNTKKKQCTMLNNSIRKHGSDNFEVQLLERCLPKDANELEAKYIDEMDTLAPKGYNLSEGGKKGSSSLEHRKKAATNTIKQFADKKLEKYKNIQMDHENLQKYLYEYTSYDNTYYCIKINGIKSIFATKFVSKEELKQQALEFLKKVSEQNKLCNTTKLRELP